MKPRAKQQEQFIEIIDQYKKLIYKISNAYCQGEQNRKDLRQEIILQLWRSFPKYDDQFALSTWIYRIALHVSISFQRKEKRRKLFRLRSLPKDPFLLAQEKDMQIEVDEQLQRLHVFISKLKKLDKALMILYLEEKSHAEIAEILGLSKSNVGTKINRIDALLRRNRIGWIKPMSSR
ncbi:MAG: sigma-70 family RNA polymerase sigma factor [Bacteroidota bacterium]